MFLNGAFFTKSGAPSANTQIYGKATSFSARPAVMVEGMTNDAGPLALWSLTEHSRELKTTAAFSGAFIKEGQTFSVAANKALNIFVC